MASKILTLSATSLAIFLVLSFGTPEAIGVGVGVSSLINPLFRGSSPLPKPSPPIPPQPKGHLLNLDLGLDLPVPLNATLTLDDKVDLIGVGAPDCWGGINVLGLLNVNLNCLNYGCADVIVVIWKLFQILPPQCTCDTLNDLVVYLRTTIIPSLTKQQKVCDILNSELSYCQSRCKVYGPIKEGEAVAAPAEPEPEVVAVATDKVQGTYTLRYIADYIDCNWKCLSTCLGNCGYPGLLSTARAATDLLTQSDYDNINRNVCPKCICYVVNVLPGSAVAGGLIH